MSRFHRKNNSWPMNSFARFIWLSIGLWEDLLTLTDIYKEISDLETQLVVARHTLVDLDALDELLMEFHNQVKSHELAKLNSFDGNLILNAFKDYHKVVQPHRSTLKEIRNNLGSHRTGLPWIKASSSENWKPTEWGKWEQYLINLESKCDLKNWEDFFSAVYKLLRTLIDFNLDAWYEWAEDEDKPRFFLPLYPKYHPED